MPVAGPRAVDRAKAHYKWAVRYNDAGEPYKAASHLGRAIEQISFGGGETGQDIMRSMQLACGYVERAFAEWKNKTSPIREHNMEVSFLLPSKGPYSTRSEVSLTANGNTKTETWTCHPHGSARILSVIGSALDNCAVKLSLDADTRVFLQKIVHEAYCFLIDDMNTTEEGRSEKRRRSSFNE